jgi:hypothetical protein
MLVNFDLIPQMTACRVGVDENICREVIMFHWKLVSDLLSSCVYTKVRVKGFANFEMKRIFLKKVYAKTLHNVEAANENLLQFPNSKRAQDLVLSANKNAELITEIYLKHWIEYANETA